ncbi:MAG: exodeoxyribonuclease VII large subunit [Sphingobium sp.]
MVPETEFDPSGRLLAEERAGDNAAPLSVTELSQMLRRTVEDRFGHVRLRGEISGYKRAASGHVYLALKDDGAVIDGVMWKGQAARIPFPAQDGIEVVATGKLTTYPGRSKYQIVIDRLELAGEGALMAMLERVKAKLGAEGLFDAARKRPLPFLPRTIGVVTSPTGAVIRDILHRLADRCPTDVLLWPVLVQGEGAALQIARAVRGLATIAEGGRFPRPDLIIVARGGGSIEDLWSFNEESVVRAVAESPIPVISAVGHETDTTLCDHAADMRAPTPTAAAEIAVPVRADLVATLAEFGLRADRAVRRGVSQARERVAMQSRLLPAPDMLLASQRQRVDLLCEALASGLRHRIAAARTRLGEAGGALRPALLRQRVARAREQLDTLRPRPDQLLRGLRDRAGALDRVARHFASLDPDRPLALGFARVMAGDRVIKGVTAARAAGSVSLRFADGAVGAHVAGEDEPPALEKAVAVNISAPAPRRPRGRPEPGQPDLFS